MDLCASCEIKLAQLAAMGKNQDPRKLAREPGFGVKREDVEEVRKQLAIQEEKQWEPIVRAYIREAERMQRAISDRGWDAGKSHAPHRIELARGAYESKDWHQALSHIAATTPELMKGYYSGYAPEEVERWVKTVEESSFMGQDSAMEAVSAFKAKQLDEGKAQVLKETAAKAEKEKGESEE